MLSLILMLVARPFLSWLKHLPQTLDKVLREYSKCNISVIEIEDQYNELSYSECSKPVKEIEDKYLKSQPGKTIVEKVKLMP